MEKYLYTFKQWFLDINGFYLEINLHDRKIEIFNLKDEVISVAYFSNDVPVEEISSTQLLKTEHKKSYGYTYFVVPNGYYGKNWIYRREFLSIGGLFDEVS